MTASLRLPAGPTPLTLSDLTTLTRQVAAEVTAGRHEVRFDAANRWYAKLRATPYVDVWLISFTPEQTTQLHDHAGSLGALTVVRGELVEVWWRRRGHLAGLSDRTLRPGRTVGFPLGHVHDVCNVHAAPAVSVHAYSPPLTAMSYYEVDPAGALRRVRTELTNEPDAVTVGA